MIELSTQTWGSAERSILLLHGITSNAEGWWRVGPALAELGFKVVAPDLRGHGLSHHSQDYRLSSHADDVLRLGGHWDAVIGHSMGGSVALEAYSPAWTDRVILEDPAFVLAAEDADLILRGFSVEATPAAVREANPGWDRVLVLGISYKPGVSDVRETPATAVIRQLRQIGADVFYADPHVGRFEVDGEEVPRTSDPTAASRRADLVIIHTPHAEFDLKAISAVADRILDTRGTLSSSDAHGL